MLTSLLGLSALITIDGGLTIDYNPALTTLGLDALVSIKSVDPTFLILTIKSNGALPTCLAYALKDRLVANGWTGKYDFSDNDDLAVCP